MALIETWLRTDVREMVRVTHLEGNLFTGDADGNLFGAVVTDGGEPVNLTGAVSGFLMLDDGATVVVNGQKDGNRAWIEIPAAACTVPGRVRIALKVGTVTVAAAVARCRVSDSGEHVPAENLVPTLTELLEQVNGAQAAAAAANAEYLKLAGITAEAVALEEGEAPTAAISTADGHRVLTVGIPAGATGPQGPQGETGPQGPKGETGEKGETGDLPAEIASTAETAEIIDEYEGE